MLVPAHITHGTDAGSDRLSDNPGGAQAAFSDELFVAVTLSCMAPRMATRLASFRDDDMEEPTLLHLLAIPSHVCVL